MKRNRQGKKSSSFWIEPLRAGYLKLSGCLTVMRQTGREKTYSLRRVDQKDGKNLYPCWSLLVIAPRTVHLWTFYYVR